MMGAVVLGAATLAYAAGVAARRRRARPAGRRAGAARRVTGFCTGCEIYRLSARLRGIGSRRITRIDPADVGDLPDGAVVQFTHPLCSECHRLERDLRGQGRSVITVDVRHRPDLARKYGVAIVPTAIAVDAGAPCARESPESPPFKGTRPPPLGGTIQVCAYGHVRVQGTGRERSLGSDPGFCAPSRSGRGLGWSPEASASLPQDGVGQSPGARHRSSAWRPRSRMNGAASRIAAASSRAHSIDAADATTPIARPPPIDRPHSPARPSRSPSPASPTAGSD